MRNKRVLITGGAGFVGCNAARYFGSRNWQVTVLDDLSRDGTEQNLTWLRDGTNFDFERVDIRERAAVERVLAERRYDAVIHLAAQVAVTTSVTDPRTDFMVNALGTFNLLDAVRRHSPEAVFIFASTNKVYGKIDGARYELRGSRYAYVDRPHGIDESEALDFLSPYGCSKGAADQYTLDFARIYGIPATVFRQSCIYGTRQFGIEDQGWVAWFTIASRLRRPITVYGDGKQVRDVLHVDDLVRAYEAAIMSPEKITGQAFNIGGGPSHLLSLVELLELLEQRMGRKIALRFDDWRPGDQRVYISDVRKLERVLGWKPEIGVAEGIAQLDNWVRLNEAAFGPPPEAAAQKPAVAIQEPEPVLPVA
jgi:CDP-paratose 2-epimerase